ncbi:unnamed protein product [Zymoseptoria tritici ST99CH_3D1]|nr:unnamed protein product [Zymoseptoria tritici ST99CH_3D1]
MFTTFYVKISLCIITIIIEYFRERIGHTMGRPPVQLEQAQPVTQEVDEDKEEVEDTRKSRKKPLDVAELAKKLKAEAEAQEEPEDMEEEEMARIEKEEKDQEEDRKRYDFVRPGEGGPYDGQEYGPRGYSGAW